MRSQRFTALIEEKGFNAAEEFVWIYKEAQERYLKGGQNLKALSIALDAASEIASYCFPKLKSIEHTKVNALSGMSAQEKLQALKDAQTILELEIKANESR